MFSATCSLHTRFLQPHLRVPKVLMVLVQAIGSRRSLTSIPTSLPAREAHGAPAAPTLPNVIPRQEQNRRECPGYRCW